MSCSTGMDASYLNKPAINFIPSYLNTYLNNPIKEFKISSIYKEEVQNITDLVLKKNH